MVGGQSVVYNAEYIYSVLIMVAGWSAEYMMNYLHYTLQSILQPTYNCGYSSRTFTF